jgi:hypothetical protein
MATNVVKKRRLSSRELMRKEREQKEHGAELTVYNNNPMHRHHQQSKIQSPPSKWKKVREYFLTKKTIQYLQSSTTKADIIEEVKQFRNRLQNIKNLNSGSSLLRKKIQHKFLLFILFLTIIIVTALAGFGTEATAASQQQTIYLLGNSLLSTVVGDLRSLQFKTEREVVQFGIGFPFDPNNETATLYEGTRSMFAQLDSSNGMDDSTLKNASKGKGSLWQIYFANDNNLVVGISRALNPKNKADYWECWGRRQIVGKKTMLFFRIR